jgi:hypothetical protein
MALMTSSSLWSSSIIEAILFGPGVLPLPFKSLNACSGIEIFSYSFQLFPLTLLD